MVCAAALLRAALLCAVAGLTAAGCDRRSDDPDDDASAADDDASAADDDASGDDDAPPERADVQAVTASGDPGEYAFSVTVRSPDTGCDQYADWWEVVSPDGELLFRRILQHSHVDEQPFTRGGEPVPIQPDDTLVVRAHMNELGYGGAAMRGSVAAGFEPASDIGADFAPELESQEPLPEECLW